MRLVGLALVVSLLSATPARAEVVLGVDSSVSRPLDQDALHTGYSLRGQVGYEMVTDGGGVRLTPGVAFEYGRYGIEGLPEVPASQKLALAGVRAALGDVVRPSLSLELGYGERQVTIDRDALGRFEAAKRGLALGLGAALDVVLGSGVSLGIHVRYRSLNGNVELSGGGKTMEVGSSPLAWIDAGAHVVMRF